MLLAHSDSRSDWPGGRIGNSVLGSELRGAGGCRRSSLEPDTISFRSAAGRLVERATLTQTWKTLSGTPSSTTRPCTSNPQFPSPPVLLQAADSRLQGPSPQRNRRLLHCRRRDILSPAPSRCHPGQRAPPPGPRGPDGHPGPHRERIGPMEGTQDHPLLHLRRPVHGWPGRDYGQARFGDLRQDRHIVGLVFQRPRRRGGVSLWSEH